MFKRIWQKFKGFIIGVFGVSAVLAASTLVPLSDEFVTKEYIIGGEQVIISEQAIGAEKKFKPEVKLKKWGEETYFKIWSDDVGDKKAKEINGKVVWKNKDKDKEYHFYPLPPTDQMEGGGFEFEIILNKKPKTNIIWFNVETKDLDFYYQPEITDEEALAAKNERPSFADLTLLEIKRKIRPENVVGSYAVYHSEKSGDYSALGGTNYQAGKALHAYYPYLIDATGWKVRADDYYINVDTGFGRINMPDEFIKTATYPVIVDPTFGYTAIGGSWEYIGISIEGSIFNAPEDGTVDSIFMYSDNPSGAAEFMKYGLYLHADLSYIDKTAQGSANTSEEWVELAFGSPPAITNGTTYVIVCHASENDEGPSPTYDAGAANQGHHDWVGSYENWVDPLVPSHDTDKFSIYASYTATPSDTCSYSGSGDWYIHSSDNCYITSDVYVGGDVHLLNRGSGGLSIIDGAKLYTANFHSTSTPVYMDYEAGSTIGKF